MRGRSREGELRGASWRTLGAAKGELQLNSTCRIFAFVERLMFVLASSQRLKLESYRKQRLRGSCCHGGTEGL